MNNEILGNIVWMDAKMVSNIQAYCGVCKKYQPIGHDCNRYRMVNELIENQRKSLGIRFWDKLVLANFLRHFRAM